MKIIQAALEDFRYKLTIIQGGVFLTYNIFHLLNNYVQ